jgi:glycerol-3-phosphate dehydrogenase
MKNGIGVQFNPAEDQEMMASFNAIVSGLQKHGEQLTDDEGESIRALLHAEAISPDFVRTVVREYGDASVAAAFLIQRETVPEYLEYLLRRYKGHFYRRRYPSLSLADQ